MLFEILTPINTGAIAIIELRAMKVEIDSFVADCWRVRRNNKLEKLKKPSDFNEISYGYIVRTSGQADARSPNLEIIDEALLIRKTPLKIEIHIHGGHGVALRLFELLENRGFKRAAKAQNHLSELFISARTEKEAKLIARQPEALKSALNNLIRLLEASKFDDATQFLEQIAANAKIASYLENPPSVLLLGKPNVGKSTLLNYVAGFERVIVSNISGTTRDVIEYIVGIEGWSIKLLDTAGVRTSNDFIEKASVIRTLKHAKQADLLVFMLDATTEITDEEKQILEKLKERNHIITLNKSDIAHTSFSFTSFYPTFKEKQVLPPAALRAFVPLDKGDRNEVSGGLEISAKTGENVDLLLKRILEQLGFPEHDEDLILPFKPLNIGNIDFIRSEVQKFSGLQNCKFGLSELIENIKKLESQVQSIE